MRPVSAEPTAAPSAGLVVRAAREEDEQAAVRLLYISAQRTYDRYAGDEAGAARVLSAAYRRHGTNVSRDVVTLAELDGEVVGVLAAFPLREAESRARAFMRLAVGRTPPWRWPRMLRGAAPEQPRRPAPPEALYIDALATAEHVRRRGVASALLAEAERRAAGAGFTHVALQTEQDNEEAQALYRRHGFEETGRRPPTGDTPGYIGLAKRVGGRGAR